jgi:uncharacterized repeat protein (TIGR01451 family)
MKRQFAKILQRVAAVTISVVLMLSQVAKAEDNTGTGDIAGDGAALVDSNTFQLFSTGAALSLVKTAFLTGAGTELGSGSTLPSGTLVDFMIYVNNQASVPINDASIQDVLDPLFVYQAGTIRVDNSVANCAAAACTNAEEAAIYAAAAAAGAGTDAVAAGDSVSFTGGNTVDVGNQSQANDQQDAVANSVLAVVFTVQVQ